MDQIDAQNLSERLQWEQQDYWLHIESSSPLEKYPAKQHAQRVVQKLDVSRGLIYLPGAPTTYFQDSDQSQPFRQRRYFYYLSGVNETDCHLTYDINQDILTLFIPRIDPSTVIWNGRGSTLAEAYDKYDVDAVCYTTALPDFIKRWPMLYEGNIYILHPNQGPIPGQDKLPRVDSTNLQIAMDAARMIKDSHEIKLIRKANDITAKAHREVLANILKFKNEAQVEAIFLDACVAEDAKHQAYEVIAASGENASTLHYIKNDEPLEGRQLMCLDAGCEWECYASDVTRTFPLSGVWPSKEAKEIYDLVQNMQTACISRLAPGVRFLDLHILAHQIAIQGLMSLGILHNGEPEEIYRAGTSRAFFPHGLGHHLGLEVHDVGQNSLMAVSSDNELDLTVPKSKSKYPANYHLPVYHSEMCRSPVDPQSSSLEEGMVVTVEPGIYFSRYALSTVYFPSPIHSKYINKEVLLRYLSVGGVRIEDDILIASSGYENLTTAPKGEEMLRIIKSQGSDASESIFATETTEAPAVVSGKIKDAEWLNTFDTSTQSASRTSDVAQNTQPRFDFGFMGKALNPYSQLITDDSHRHKSPLLSQNGHNVAVDTSTKCENLEGNKYSRRYTEARETSNRIHKSSEAQTEVSPASVAKFRACTYCKKRLIRCSGIVKREDDDPSEVKSCTNCARFGFAHECDGMPMPSLVRRTPPATTYWDGLDGLGFEDTRPFEYTPRPPELPQKPLAYRHSLPCLKPQHPNNQSQSQRPNPDADPYKHINEIRFDMRPSAISSTTEQRPREFLPDIREEPEVPAKKFEQSHRLARPRSETWQPSMLPPSPLHLRQPPLTFRYYAQPPQAWGALRNCMNLDPPAVPKWLSTELDSLRQKYPECDIAPTMLYSAVDAQTSQVLNLDSELPPPASPGVLYTYLPRIRCADCPGKLYTPPVENFEIHLRNRHHKAAMERRLNQMRKI